MTPYGDTTWQESVEKLVPKGRKWDIRAPLSGEQFVANGVGGIQTASHTLLDTRIVLLPKLRRVRYAYLKVELPHSDMVRSVVIQPLFPEERYRRPAYEPAFETLKIVEEEVPE